MAWALLDDNFPHHPKTVKAGNAAAYLFVCGLCYCRKYHTGGAIPRAAVRNLGVIGNERKLVDALIDAGLWARTDDGFLVHDYDRVYASDADDKAKREERSQKKREAGRKGGNARVAALGLKPLDHSQLDAAKHWIYCGQSPDKTKIKVGCTSDRKRREVALRNAPYLLSEIRWWGFDEPTGLVDLEMAIHAALRKECQELPHEHFFISAAKAAPTIEAVIRSSAKAVCFDSGLSTVQAYRVGVVRTGLVISAGSSEEKGEPRFDFWIRELQEDYPQQRVTSGHLTEKAFIDALLSEPDGPHAAWRRMRDNLENQKRGHEWRVTPKYIPKLENWLRSGAWKQQHDETPPNAVLSEKTIRNLSSAAEFIKAGER